MNVFVKLTPLEQRGKKEKELISRIVKIYSIPFSQNTHIMQCGTNLKIAIL